MVNWDIIRAAERNFDERYLHADTVKVVVPTYVATNSNNMFKAANSITSGVYTVPGTFEYDQFKNMRFMQGGALPEGDAYFMADVRWQDTFLKDSSYILHVDTDGTEEKYIIQELKKSNVHDSIIAVLSKKS